MNIATKQYAELINNALADFLCEKSIGDNIVSKAMRYSVQDGGKRIRPILTLEFCRICGGNAEDARNLACSIEFVHAYSLIHDDLPCMDDDDIRRGKPSCHKQFGEEYALLAGDALLTLAFKAASLSKNADAIEIIADYAGINGMIGGQTIDLQNENRSINIDELRKMDSLKTGKLISAACILGCMAANANEEKINAAKEYAENIGLAFQIRDDILDVVSTQEVFGKPIGSDSENKKSTYVSLLGIEESTKLIDELTEKAISALNVFGGNVDFLVDFAKRLAVREK